MRAVVPTVAENTGSSFAWGVRTFENVCCLKEAEQLIAYLPRLRTSNTNSAWSMSICPIL